VRKIFCKSGDFLLAENSPNEDMTIGGNRISLKTLDLGMDWKAITAQLDNKRKRLC